MPVKRILVIKEGSPELVGLAAVSHQKLLAEYVAGSKFSSNGLHALPPLIIIAFLCLRALSRDDYQDEGVYL